MLLFAYRVPQNSYFPAHDYLDHLFVLYSLRGDNPFYFDYSATLFGVLGQIPLSSLGISDLSLDANLFVIFDAPVAAVLNEFISRNIAFCGMYLFLHTLLPEGTSKYVFLAPSLLFSLLPFYPNFALTIAFMPIIAYVLLAALSSPLRPFQIFMVILASLFGNFTYGGFAVVGFVLLLILVHLLKKKFRISCRLTVVTLILVFGYCVGISRILVAKFAKEFQSHRISWEPITENWFDPTFIPDFFSEFLNISLKGNYHFPSGQSVFSNLFIPGIPALLLVYYISVRLSHSIQKKGLDLPERRDFLFIRYLLVAILALNLFYSCEASGLTHFESLISEPFQFKRVAVLLPFLWCVLTAFLLSILIRNIPVLATLTFILIVMQVSVSNFGVQKQILHYAGLEGSRETINEYFDTDAYLGLARSINLDPSKIRVVSYDLDPMVASFNGFQSFDGYVYNYPLDYKIAFRKVISGELSVDQNLREYYDNWGSRVYIFHRNLPPSEIQIDWCAALHLGAEFVLSRKDLSSVVNLKLFGSNKGLRIYKISNCKIS
jgi:hypothetical protein